MSMVIEIDAQTLVVALNDGKAAAQLAASLPQTIAMSRWGDGEYYGTLKVPIASNERRRDVFEVGEVALWPDGNALCLFFGPTPASHGDEPRMASPGIPLGRVVSGLEVLRGLGSTKRMTLAATPPSRRE